MPIIWEPFVKFADFVLFHEYVGMYFYSAAFQGNMALIAIFGVFLVFRLQLLDQEIAKALTDAKEHIYSKILNHANTVVYPVVRKLNSLEKLRDEIIKWSKETKSDAKISFFITTANDLKRDTNFKEILIRGLSIYQIRFRTIEKLEKAILPIALLIIYSLIMLAFTFSINHSNRSIELLLMLSAIGLELYSLKVLYRFVLDTIVDIGDIDTAEIEKHELFQ